MPVTHVVRPGDCLSRIARAYGFATWRTIYDHPANAAFKQRRPNPNLIFPGDEIIIPTQEPRWVDRPTGELHRFISRSERTYLPVVVRDDEDRPFADAKFKLTIGDRAIEGTTDADGKIDVRIPAAPETARIEIWPDPDLPEYSFGWQLQVGHLDPVTELTGVQARLNNLGYDVGAVDGVFHPQSKAAVKAFQLDYDLLADGIPGPLTQQRLEEVHGY